MSAHRSPVPSIPCPPARIPPYLRFLVVPPEATYRLTIGSPEVWGCYTHWNGQRTVWCPAQAHECPSSCPRIRKVWTGYFLAYMLAIGAPRIVQITEAMYRGCPKLAERAGELTRCVVNVRRMGNWKNAPLRVEWTGERREGELTPLDDVRVYLGNLWDVDLTGEGR